MRQTRAAPSCATTCIRACHLPIQSTTTPAACSQRSAAARRKARCTLYALHGSGEEPGRLSHSPVSVRGWLQWCMSMRALRGACFWNLGAPPCTLLASAGRWPLVSCRHRLACVHARERNPHMIRGIGSSECNKCPTTDDRTKLRAHYYVRVDRKRTARHGEKSGGEQVSTQRLSASAYSSAHQRS